ncbi:iron chelate uptake ABC transporter family permease subunit [Streptomyces sp. NRRL_B-2557]|nr:MULTISPECIES: iron chelate uptake ABC transporter family permease subunit [Streptomyces]MDX2748064.1 iron chelate uptake ABC transporter family permease subunit [Streptomyces sp. NRRL_B-2557]
MGRSPSAVLLTGAAVAAALQAALLVLMVMADQLDLQLIYRYLLGSLSARTWEDVTGLWPWLLVAAPALVLCAPVACALGHASGRRGCRGAGCACPAGAAGRAGLAVVLIAPVTAVCGPVAWVGFLAPHLARWFNPRADAVRWLPWSAVWGAVVVAVADVPARLALAPVETPAGAWTALLGVPAGIALMRSRRRDRMTEGSRTGAGAVRTLVPGPRTDTPRPDVEAPHAGGRGNDSQEEPGARGTVPLPGETTGTEEAR